MSRGVAGASLAEGSSLYEAGEPVQAAAFLGATPVLVRDNGGLTIGTPGAAIDGIAHPDSSILCSATTASHLFTGGDDGRVVMTDAGGATTVVHESGGKWIDALAARGDGCVGWASGKIVFSRNGAGTLRETSVGSTARGLAFAPKGYRLAIAHYGGASLWFPNAEAAPDLYEWKGSHLAATFSPDGRFLVTAMQENALHGWRLVDRANMRMSGYPSKVRSLSWSADGAWLATSGAESCVIWPFRDKDGPMKKPPLECAVRKARVSRVCFHPKAIALAVGYEDGWIMLCRPADNEEKVVRRAGAQPGAVSALAWSADGRRLLFGTEGGEAGLVDLPAF